MSLTFNVTQQNCFSGLVGLVGHQKMCSAIMANRFRVFRRPLLLSPERCEGVVLASCALHNFLTESCNNYMVTDNDRSEEVSERLTPLTGHGISNNHTMTAKGIRDCYRDFFNSEYGMVP